MAYILQRVVDELNEMSVEVIEECIEGDIQIGDVSLMPESIRGENIEDSSYREGKIYYDLCFSIVKTEESVRILFDAEAQKKYDPGYPIVTRGIVYTSRMISRQIGTEFKIPHYAELKKVYSIWICFDPPKKVGNAISKVSFIKEDILGAIPMEKKDYDKVTIIQICLNDNAPEHEDKMIHLLNTLFSGHHSAETIEAVLEKEYHIPKCYNLGKVVAAMCNLSERIEERGIRQGLEQGIQQGELKGRLEKGIQVFRNMIQRGFPEDEAQAIADLTDEEVEIAKSHDN